MKSYIKKLLSSSLSLLMLFSVLPKAYADPTSSVGDFVWNDTNGNGLQDEGELGAAGVTITVYRVSDNQMMGTTQSGVNGSYNVGGLEPDNYYIIVSTIPPGSMITTPDANDNGNDNVDSDISPMSNFSSPFTLSAGENRTDIDVGLSSGGGGGCGDGCGGGGSGSISGVVWNDVNNNGIYEPGDGETYWMGVNISIYRVSDDSGVSGQGSSNAPYSLGGLPDGDYYMIFSNLPPDASFSPQNVGDDSVDSDVDETGRTATITISGGANITNINAGIHSSMGGGGGGGGDGDGTLRARLFTDTNGNGYKDTEESFGATGVTVTLSNGEDQVDLEPDMDGWIQMSLPPAERAYNLTFTVDEGTHITAHNNPIEQISVYANQMSDLGYIGVYTGPVGTFNLSVFSDYDGNGEQAESEPYGTNSNYTYLSIDNQFPAINVASSGFFTNVPLAPGTYNFGLVSSASGSTFTGDIASLNSVMILNNVVSNLGNFGYYEGGGGGDGGGECEGSCGQFTVVIYGDIDGDGMMDENENAGFAGTQMHIQAEGFDETIPFEENGELGGNVSVGTYTLTIIPPEGMEVSGGANPFMIEVTDGSSTTVMRGIRVAVGDGGDGGGECEDTCGHISINVFSDIDGDGVLDSGEQYGVSDTQLHIQGEGDVNMTIPFDENGNVSGEVGTGTYTLTIIPPVWGEVTGGSNPFEIEVTDGSDNTYVRGVRYVVTEDGGCEDACGEISLHLFTDTNNNGTQETWEPSNFSGATVRIQGPELNELTAFDTSGNVGGEVPVGTYTFTISSITGTVITGGNNPIHIIVTTGSNSSYTRGIYITSGGSSGSSGGGSVVYGGGGSGGSSSGSWGSSSSSNSSSSRGTRSSNQSPSNSNTPNPQAQASPAPEQQQVTLPQVTPTNTPCLISEGIAPINFYDNESADTDYLSSIIFQENRANRLIHGDGNGSFAGNQPMTRFELLKVAMGSNCVAGGQFERANSMFNDVSSDSSEISRVIGEAHSRGIIQGQNGQFYPNQPVTLGELLKILLSSSAYFPNGAPVANLPVTESGITEPSFIQPIEYAKLLGILEGYDTIDQNQIVTRNQMATIMARYIRAMNGLIIANS